MWSKMATQQVWSCAINISNLKGWVKMADLSPEDQRWPKHEN